MSSTGKSSVFSKAAVMVLPENEVAKPTMHTGLRQSKSSPWVQTWLTSEKVMSRGLRKSVSFARQSDVSTTGASVYIDDERFVEEEANCVAPVFPIHPLA